MQDMTHNHKPTARKRRALWHVLRVVALLIAVPLVFAAVAAAMLVNTDVAAPDWVKSRVAARAGAVMQGGDLQFEDMTITIGRDLHPRVRLDDTRLHDADGRQIARIPRIEGLMSPRGLLFEAGILMQDIQLTGAQINLDRNVDGSVALAFGGGGGFDTAPSLAALLDQSDRIFDRPALAALETVTAQGVIINYVDAQAGQSWTVDGGLITLDLRDGQTVLDGDFALLTGGADITRLQVSYQSARGSPAADIGVTLANARARDIASQTPALAWLGGVDAALTATMRTGLDDDGQLGPLSASLDIGQGALQPNAATDPVVFDGAKAYLTYDPASDQITFDDITVDAAAGRFSASGRAYLREKSGGFPQSLVAQINLPDVSLAQGGLYADGITLPPVSVDMRMRFNPFVVDIGQLAMVDGDTHIIAKGQLSATPDGWDIAADAQVDQISTARFTDLWPAGFKPKSRDWMVRNVTGGMLRDMQFGIRADQMKPAVVAAGFAFDDAQVKFMAAMPPLTRTTGLGFLQENRLTIAVDRGGVTAPRGGRVDLAGSTFEVLDTRVAGGQGQLDLALKGPITAALSLLDQKPFAFLTKAGRPVDLARGAVALRGGVTFPLRKGAARDDIRYNLKADLRDVQTGKLIKDRDLRAARLALEVDNDGLRIAGPARVDGIAVDGAWAQAFGTDKSQLRATIALSPATLETFNINLPARTVTGAGQGDLIVDLVKGRAPQFTLSSDLRGIGIAIPAVGWRKAAATQGRLRVAGTLGPVAQISKLEVSGGGLTARGDVRLKDNGSLDRVQLQRLQIGDWLDAPVTLRGRGQGRPVGVSIGGGRLDLRRAALGAGGGGATGPLDLRLERLQLTQGIALHDFRGEFSGGNGLSGEFTGRVNGGPMVLGTVVPRGGRSAIRLRSDDAGGVVAAAGLVKNGTGGSLDVTLLPTGGAGTFDGNLAVRNLRVRDAPAIATLLDSISVIGLLRQLDGKGIAFDEVDAAFRLTPTQVIVTQSSAVGPGLGISLDGIYTLANKQIDFQGVVSPFYILNSIGSIFTRKGEGLIGFSFNLTGAANAPQVLVNPLSALTPGMFREIFRRPPPQVSQ